MKSLMDPNVKIFVGKRPTLLLWALGLSFCCFSNQMHPHRGLDPGPSPPDPSAWKLFAAEAARQQEHKSTSPRRRAQSVGHVSISTLTFEPRKDFPGKGQEKARVKCGPCVPLASMVNGRQDCLTLAQNCFEDRQVSYFTYALFVDGLYVYNVSTLLTNL